MFNEHANWRRKCTILCVCFFFGVVNKAHAALVMVVRCCCYCRFYRRQITYENVYPSTRTPHLVRLRRSTMPRNRQARMSANEQPAQLWIHERSERKKKRETFIFDKYESSTFRTHIFHIELIKISFESKLLLPRWARCSLFIKLNLWNIRSIYLLLTFDEVDYSIARRCSLSIAMPMPMTWSLTHNYYSRCIKFIIK